MMNRQISLSILLLTSLVGIATAQSGSRSNITAYWVDYNLTNNNWDFSASHVSCAAALSSTSPEWRQQFGWTGYCNGTYLGTAICGKCLKVTNTATGDERKVRIFDTCGGDHLNLDYETAFKPLDTDGGGLHSGHLTVDYELVDCDAVDDDDEPDATNITAYWVDYNLTKNNWDFSSSAVYCAAALNHTSLQWRQMFGWTGYCNGTHQGEAICGKCLNVTNTALGNQQTVRIFDTCGGNQLNLDFETAFKPLDIYGQGWMLGHLTVDYKFVDCPDEDNTVLVSSM